MKPQVEKLIVGTGVAGQTTAKTFIASATAGQIKVLNANGGAVAAGGDFKVYQKTADGFEFSDIIKADKVEKVTVATYQAEVQKKVTLSTFAVQANSTYVVNVRVYNSISNENFDVVSGYYVTGAVVTNVTVANIIDGLAESLQNNFKLRGDNEVTITKTGSTLVIEGKAQKVVPGKKDGRQIKFDVTTKVYDNVSLLDENLGIITTTVTTAPFPGVGTGKYAQNLEWFTKGYDNEVYRQTGYPADFDTPYYTKADGIYNVIHIFYYDGRDYTTVEKQHKLLTILVDKGTDTNPNNANTNAILTSLRTVLGATNVPAALST